MGDMDFALAQVRDRDLVIGSLREEKDTLEMERNMAEEAAAGFKEEVESLREQLADCAALVAELNAAGKTAHDRVAAAEAKLAEERKAVWRHPRQNAGVFSVYLCHVCGWGQTEEERDLTCARCGESRSMIETVEVVPMTAKLAEAERRTSEYTKTISDMNAKLAEVEKERDRLKAANLTLADRITAAGFSMDRARELAEGKDPMGDVTGKHLNRKARLEVIARILSGDEKGKCKHCGAEVGNVICGTADRGTMFSCSNYSGDE